MYISFSKTEARAIISLVLDMIAVDGKVHENEDWLGTQLMIKFSMTDSDMEIAKHMKPDEVASIISGLPWEKRKLISYILASIAAIDGYVDKMESSTYFFISHRCNLITSEIDFNVAMMAVKDFLS